MELHQRDLIMDLVVYVFFGKFIVLCLASDVKRANVCDIYRFVRCHNQGSLANKLWLTVVTEIWQKSLK